MNECLLTKKDGAGRATSTSAPPVLAPEFSIPVSQTLPESSASPQRTATMSEFLPPAL